MNVDAEVGGICLFKAGVIFINLTYLLSEVTTQIYNQKMWNSLKHFASLVTVCVGGGFILVNAHNLRELVLQTNKTIGRIDTVVEMKIFQKKSTKRKLGESTSSVPTSPRSKIDQVDLSATLSNPIASFQADESAKKIGKAEQYLEKEVSGYAHSGNTRMPLPSFSIGMGRPLSSGEDKMTRKLRILLISTVFVMIFASVALVYVISNQLRRPFEPASQGYEKNRTQFSLFGHINLWVPVLITYVLMIYTSPASNKIRIWLINCCKL